MNKVYTKEELRALFEEWVNETWVFKALGRFRDGSYKSEEVESSFHAFLQCAKILGALK